MKHELAREWLRAAYSDIVVLHKIVDDEYITHMTAFHSQQAIEKILKAILEYHSDTVPKKHDILMLKDRVMPYLQIDKEDLFEDLNALYIDSRYPGNMGLLPYGKPTLKDAKEFYDFTNAFFIEVCELLNIELKEIRE